MNRIYLAFQLFFIFFTTSELLSQDKLKFRSGDLRVRKHCLVPWNNSWYHAEITAMDNHYLTLVVHDHNYQLKDWPKITLKEDQVKLITPYTGNTLQGLIEELTNTHKLEAEEIKNALYQIDRSWFCSEYPYYDASVDIGHKSCISSPHMHVSALELSKHLFHSATSVLDLGSGSGYLTALYSLLCPNATVVGIEFLPELVEKSRQTIDAKLGEELQKRIVLTQGDGEKGHMPQAPYDVINVGFMCEEVSPSLIEQLRPGGRLIIPVGNRPSYCEGLISGNLMIFDKQLDGSIVEQKAFSCMFVPSSNSKAYTDESDS